MNKKLIGVAMLTAALLIGGCSSTLSQVSGEGTTEEPIFPNPDKVTFNNDQGTFPNIESLRTVKAGMTKDQLYYLLGRPHFQEGLFGVREWDYLFHFHRMSNGKNEVVTCQFKVLFDKHYVAQSFFMRPVGEPNELCSLDKPAKVQQFNLEADGLFDFDKSGVRDLKPKGIEKLQNLAKELAQNDNIRSIDIVGYTDPLGGVIYNQRLSARRAHTVMQYLGSLGVPMDLMEASGAGPTSEFAQCDRSMPRESLIACFEPNRRVTVGVKRLGADTMAQ
ncbi:OmpA/MotB domain protein (plasmid) [Advenella kashmirensis WT001]|uniref:OmpA/MotB domain protein n=2 Tax=Advenella kashmirensis TaxID=310575 RepID=I3UI33_ADVKW|nr:OmpA/MotB domain protein [Advenella kashmirensis WT001]